MLEYLRILVLGPVSRQSNHGLWLQIEISNNMLAYKWTRYPGFLYLESAQQAIGRKWSQRMMTTNEDLPVFINCVSDILHAFLKLRFKIRYTFYLPLQHSITEL